MKTLHLCLTSIAQNSRMINVSNAPRAIISMKTEAVEQQILSVSDSTQRMVNVQNVTLGSS